MKSKYFHDALLVAALISASLILWLLFSPGSKTGDTVEITVNGESFGVYELASNAEINVDGLLTVVIENGQVYVTGQTCRNRICANHSPISKAGQTIICLPRGVVIKITGETEIDAVI